MNRVPGIAAAVAAVIILAGCNDETQAPPEPVRPVLSVIAKPMPARTLSLAGTVEPQYKTELSFRVLGRMIARNVDVADLVKKGEVLAALDPTALELAVRSAMADLSNTQAQLANAFATEGRQRSLLESNVTAKATYETAQQELATAQSNVVRAQAALSKAREQLSYAQLKSDYDGVVTATGAEVGQVVSPGETVLTVARPDVREAVIDVPDGSAGPLKTGTPFTVALQLNPDTTVSGRVREIAPQADPVTRTRRVKITLDNPPRTFRIGATVTASATTDDAPTIRLPRSALSQKDGKTFVWVVDPQTGTVLRRDVRATPNGEQASVTVISGVEPGERVVTAGALSLADGQKVKVDEGDFR